MKTRLARVLPTAFLCLLAAGAAPAQEPADGVVLRLRPGSLDPATNLDLATGLTTGHRAFDALLREQDVRRLAPFIERPDDRPPKDPASYRELALDRFFVVELAPGRDLATALEAFAASSLVEHAEPHGTVSTTAVPNDPRFQFQWALKKVNDNDIDADLAWNITVGDASIVVAVVDTGVDGDHPDLVGGLVPGWDFVNQDADPEDDHGHGTAVSGIIGARGNNGIGVAGVAWLTSIMPVKSLNQNGNGTNSSVSSGIVWAADNGARIINMSLGGAANMAAENAIEYATGLDVLCLAASGNGDAPSILYPARYPDCMAIGATSPCDQRKSPASCDLVMNWGSNYGPQLDLVAPGIFISTTDLAGGYTPTFAGTSAATPFASGVAALVLALDPNLTAWQVRGILLNSAEDQVGPANPVLEDTPGFDIFFGHGRLNAHKALLLADQGYNWKGSVGDGGSPAGGPSHLATPDLSRDAQLLAFSSLAEDLVAMDGNGVRDVFLRDLALETNVLVGAGPLGPPNGPSESPALAADGRWLAFASRASNLVPGDFNGFSDVFVYDHVSATMVRLTEGAAGGGANGDSLAPAISTDGRWVAFTSHASDLAPADGNGAADVFLHDRDSDGNGVFDEAGGSWTLLVSRDGAGGAGNGPSGLPSGPALSADGRHVAFESDATLLAPPDTNGVRDVLAYDAATGALRRVSLSPTGAEADAACGEPSLSDDGRLVGFSSAASTLALPVGPGTDVFVVDRDTDGNGVYDELGGWDTEIVSLDASAGAANGASQGPSLSGNGRWVAFSSEASDLVAGDTNGLRDVFVRDRELDATEAVSVTPGDAVGNGASALFSAPAVSANGSWVAFESEASDLTPVDPNGLADVYLRQRYSDELFATAFCFCDGIAGGTPPCGNFGAPGEGCAHSLGHGARLAASGTSRAVSDDLVLTVSGLPPGKNGIFFMGPGRSNGTLGSVLGAGLRCVGTGGVKLFRFPLANSGALGMVTLGPGLRAESCAKWPLDGCLEPGSTWNFQFWFRDPGGPCATVNLSNAVSVSLAP